MSTNESTCCPEYAELSRRGFMKTAGATAATIAAANAWLPRVSLAKDYRSTQRDVLVWVYLRGASDGMSICVPHGENEYYLKRPVLAVPRPDSGDPRACLDLDGFFGMPPAMAPLMPAYQNGRLAYVHACGSRDDTRSHFDGQRYMEVGTPSNPNLITGWLGRHLATVAPMQPDSSLRAVGMSTGLPQVLVGGPSTLPIPNLDTFGLQGASGTRAARTTALRDLYTSGPQTLQSTAATTLDTITLLDQIDFTGYQPAGGAVYNTAVDVGYALKTSAALIKAEVGVEAICIDLHNWDTHTSQGVHVGTMFTIMNRLALAMAAFERDMSTGTNPTYTMVVISEFGRRLAENGSLGTDHGHGNAMMVMGSNVNGQRVIRQWPGLAPENLFQGGDLQVTIDYRDILSEIIDRRLGNANISSVFPGFAPTYRGVVL